MNVFIPASQPDCRTCAVATRTPGLTFPVFRTCKRVFRQLPGLLYREAINLAEKHVVLVHGLWMTGHELGLLGRRLASCGYKPLRFPYPDLRASIADNARRLNQFLRDQQLESANLVGHSLGGIVVLRALHDFPDMPVARTVLLGSPVRGSTVTRRLVSFPPATRIFGKSLEQGLAGNVRIPRNLDNIGMIAGTRPVGFGRLVGGLDGPSDGAVAVTETELPGGAAWLQVRTTHIGLVISRGVALQICHFLENGRFSPTITRSGPL